LYKPPFDSHFTSYVVTFIVKQVRMYFRSGTGAGHSSCGSSFLCERTSWLPSWNCYVKSKIWLSHSMRIYSKNILAIFHPNRIWNDGASGFSKWCNGRHLELMMSCRKSDSVIDADLFEE